MDTGIIRFYFHDLQGGPLEGSNLMPFCLVILIRVVATQRFVIFTPKIGEDAPILTNIFQMG